jgi:hypothetical protein
MARIIPTTSQFLRRTPVARCKRALDTPATDQSVGTNSLQCLTRLDFPVRPHVLQIGPDASHGNRHLGDRGRAAPPVGACRCRRNRRSRSGCRARRTRRRISRCRPGSPPVPRSRRILSTFRQSRLRSSYYRAHRSHRPHCPRRLELQIRWGPPAVARVSATGNTPGQFGEMSRAASLKGCVLEQHGRPKMMASGDNDQRTAPRTRPMSAASDGPRSSSPVAPCSPDTEDLATISSRVDVA